MTEPIRIELASPPDREKLVAHLMVGNELWAEINQDNEIIMVEFSSRREANPWELVLDDVIHALTEARDRLRSK